MSLSVVITSVAVPNHVKPASDFFPLAVCQPEQTSEGEPLWDPAAGEPPLAAFRARLLPVLPPAYFEPAAPRRGIFGWLRRRRHFDARPASSGKLPACGSFTIPK